MTRLQSFFRFFQPYFACFAAGALSSLAMAPTNAWYLFFIGLGGLYYFVARAQSKREAFLDGWVFGLGYFIFGLHWIGNALLVEGNPFVWVYPLAVAALPVLLGLFPAMACCLAWRLSDLRTVSGYLAFAAWLVFFEWLRGHIFTGFPWNLFGYTWADILPLVQTVSLGNIYLLTWLTILWMSVPGFLLVSGKFSRGNLMLLGAVILSAALCYGYGAWRLAHYTPKYHGGVHIRIVQPNIAQSEKWITSKMSEHFFKHVRLSYPQDDLDGLTYIVWPETAINSGYIHDKTAMGIITQALKSYSGKAYLMTGLLDRNPETNQNFNALVMIDEKGRISNIYNKHHPVPLGEYIPFQQWIPIAPVSRFSGFTAGDGPKTFETPEGIKYSPIICYEVIFPGGVTNPKEAQPDFILNVTNDAWYGTSAGPYQHFTQALFRAVEEGVPLVRAANTGFSGMIGPLGHIYYKSSLFMDETKLVPLPEKTGAPGNFIPLKNTLFLLMILAVSGFSYIKKRTISF